MYRHKYFTHSCFLNKKILGDNFVGLICLGGAFACT